jgi:hypothetical protein
MTVFVLGTSLAAALGGCAGAPPPESASTRSAGSAIAASDVRQVAGRWGGIARGPASSREDYVEMTIGEDGRYEAVTHRQTGTFRSRGQLVLSDGRYLARSERGGEAILQLMSDVSGHRRLKIDGHIDEQRTVSAELLPLGR